MFNKITVGVLLFVSFIILGSCRSATGNAYPECKGVKTQNFSKYVSGVDTKKLAEFAATLEAAATPKANQLFDVNASGNLRIEIIEAFESSLSFEGDIGNDELKIERRFKAAQCALRYLIDHKKTSDKDRKIYKDALAKLALEYYSGSENDHELETVRKLPISKSPSIAIEGKYLKVRLNVFKDIETITPQIEQWCDPKQFDFSQQVCAHLRNNQRDTLKHTKVLLDTKKWKTVTQFTDKVAYVISNTQSLVNPMVKEHCELKVGPSNSHCKHHFKRWEGFIAEATKIKKTVKKQFPLVGE